MGASCSSSSRSRLTRHAGSSDGAPTGGKSYRARGEAPRATLQLPTPVRVHVASPGSASARVSPVHGAAVMVRVSPARGGTSPGPPRSHTPIGLACVSETVQCDDQTATSLALRVLSVFEQCACAAAYGYNCSTMLCASHDPPPSSARPHTPSRAARLRGPHQLFPSAALNNPRMMLSSTRKR